MLKNLEKIFDKRFQNDKYSILFNSKTGLEITQGINGNEDPFVLELPSLLDIGIMGTCENKCKFCYQGHINQPNMLLENFKEIIDEVKHHVNQVALGGRGDPNKHENFKEILEYCRENRVVPNYTTSGINLTEEEIELSKLCGAVAVSQIFYEEIIDDKITLKTMDNTYISIEKFINAGIKTNIHFIYSRISHNIAMNMLEGKDIWKEKVDIDKLNAVIFLLFKPQGAAKYMYSKIPTINQLQQFSELIFKPKCKFKIGMDSCLVNHTTKYSQGNKLQQLSIDTCEGARMSAYITPDMHFMPCSFADRVFWSRPITDKKSITTLWQNSPPFNTFRTLLEKNQNQCPLNL